MAALDTADDGAQRVARRLAASNAGFAGKPLAARDIAEGLSLGLSLSDGSRRHVCFDARPPVV